MNKNKYLRTIVYGTFAKLFRIQNHNTQAGFGLIGGVTALVVIIGIASATMLDSMSRATKASNAVSNRGATMAVLQQAANTLSRESAMTDNGVARPIGAESGEGPAGGGRLPTSIGGYLDGYGKQLGLCSFYNGVEIPTHGAGQIPLNATVMTRESMPNAPAFVVVSAGKNGTFDLNCSQVYATVSTSTGLSYSGLRPLTEIQMAAADDMFVASDITDTANRKSQNLVNLLSSGTFCDPITQKLIYVNAGGSAEFRCVDETDPTVSANSIGTAGGIDVLKHDITTTDNVKNIQIRKLEAGNNIALSLNGDSIRIESSGSGMMTNIGTGAPVYAGIIGGAHAMRSFVGAGGTTVQAVGDHVIIQSAPPSGGTITGGQNVGTGTADVYRGASGSVLQFGRLRSGDTNKITVTNAADGSVVINPILVGAEGVNGINVAQQQPANALPDNVSGAVASPTNPEKANIFVGKLTPTSTELRFRQLKEGVGIEFHVDTDGSLVIGNSGSGAGEVDPVFSAARPSGACSATQKLTWNGSAFVCAIDLTGSGGVTVAHSGTGVQLAPESGAVTNLTLKRLNAAAGSALSVTESGGTINVGSPNLFATGGSIGVGTAPDTNYRMHIAGGNGLSVSGTGARVNVWGSGGNTVNLNNDGSITATGRITGNQLGIQSLSSTAHGMYAYPYAGVEAVQSNDPYPEESQRLANIDNLFYFVHKSGTKHARIGVEKLYAYDGIATKHNGIDINFFNYGGNTFVRGMRLYARNTPFGDNDPNGNFHIDLKRDYTSTFHPENTIALRTHNSFADLNAGNIKANGNITANNFISSSGNNLSAQVQNIINCGAQGKVYNGTGCIAAAMGGFSYVNLGDAWNEIQPYGEGSRENWLPAAGPRAIHAQAKMVRLEVECRAGRQSEGWGSSARMQWYTGGSPLGDEISLCTIYNNAGDMIGSKITHMLPVPAGATHYRIRAWKANNHWSGVGVWAESMR